MEFRILGPVEVEGAGGPIRLGSRRERAVLAALVFGGGDVVGADRLIDALWGDEPPRSAAKTLQNYVLKLRKALGPAAIETVAPGYRLETEGAVIDAPRFERLTRDATAARRAGRPHDALALAREAVALWRGNAPLEELEGWAVADAEASRLSELRRIATEELIESELACGNAGAATAELEAMVTAEPLRERRWALLMLALYRTGRQADALRTYQRARTLLGDELGIEPGPELRALETAIAAQDPALDLPPPSDADDAGGDCDADDAAAPYKGLAAFEPEDRALFFGRTELVAELVDRADRDRFLVVVGASGSGKSSVVRAGVLGALHDRASAGAPCPAVVLTPGAHPLVELAAALAPVLGRTPSDVLDDLVAGPDALVRLGRDACTGIVVVVDQLEQLFTMTASETERADFVAVLTHTLDDPAGAVTVIAALRADFYGHCGGYPALAAALDHRATLLGPMAPDALRAAIAGPAEMAGLRVDPGLTELVVRDVGTEPGALPLLSHVLLETWKRRTRGTLTVAGYQAAGGARGAIAQTAETAFDHLDGTERRLARRVFLRLVELGDGTEDVGCRLARTDLDAVDGGADAAPVVRVLADARLLTLDEEHVQLAHEALIREWPRLRGWLDEDRAGRRIHRHLTHAARDWAELGRDANELYRGPRLASVQEWLERTGPDADLNRVETEFVAAGVARAEAENRARTDAARAQVRSNRRLRTILVGTSILLVVALVAGAVALVQRSRADASARKAEVSRLVAQSVATATDDRALGGLLALEANRLQDDASTQGALLTSVVSDPRHVRTLPTGSSEAVFALPDPASVLVLSRGRLGVWDVDRGVRTAQLPVTKVKAAAVRGDGTIAVARDDGSVRFFTAAGVPTGPRIRSGLGGLLAQVAFSPDGRSVAVGYGDWADTRTVPSSRTVRLFDVADGHPGATLTGSVATVTALAFSPDGHTLATGGGDDKVVFHDVASGAPTGPTVTAPAPILGLAFDPIRPRVAIGTTSSMVGVADTHTGEIVGQLLDAPSVDTPTYDPDGTRLAAAGNGPVHLYDATTLAPVPNQQATDFGLGPRTGEPIDAQVSPARVAFLAGDRLVVGGATGPATVFDLDGVSILDRPVPNTSPYVYVFPMAGDTLIAVPDTEDSVTLVDRRTLRPVGAPLTPGPGVRLSTTFPATFAASYHDGSRIAVVNRSGALQLFDTVSRRAMGPRVETGIAPVYAVFSRDMHTIAVGGRQGQVRIVDVRSHRVRALPSPMTNYVLGLEFGPHGELAASDNGHVVMYTHPTAAHPGLRDLTRVTSASGFGMDLSPDGRTLAVSTGGLVGFYDTRTWRRDGPLVPASTSNSINWIAFDRSGTRIVTGDNANEARIVDLPSRQAVGPALGNSIAAGGSVYSHDGRTLGTATTSGGVLMSVDPRVWRRDVCTLAGRNLTADEWHKYLPDQGARRKTCPQYP